MKANRQWYWLLLLLAGCLPEERVWWSPQGDAALVNVDGRLHLTSAGGKLGEALDGATVLDAQVKEAGWLRDGSGFVAHRILASNHWDEVRAMIPEEEVKTVETIQPLVLPLLESAAKLADQATTLEELATALPDMQRERFACALRVVHEQDPAAVETLLHKLPEGDALVESLRKPEAGYSVSELCLFRLHNGRVVETRSLLRSLLKPLLMPKLSPQHDALAFLCLDDDGESMALKVAGIAGGEARVVARKVSAAFDWTPDGRSLVFMASLGEGEKLQSVYRLDVLAEDGAVMDEPSPPVPLATGITLSHLRLQVLADGRVLFASQPVTLPATGTGPELTPRLFVIAADGRSLNPLPTAPGDLPANLGFFVASPDGKRVAVVESETDAVAVVELESGKTQIVSPPHPRWQCRTLPAWRSSQELTFAALNDGQPAWMEWSIDGEIRLLSAGWPAAATARWLEHKEAESVTTKPSSAK